MSDEIMICSCGFKAVKGQFNKTKDAQGNKKKGFCPKCGDQVY